jgi:hypothetical protein
MGNMKSWMLGAAVLAAGMAAGTGTAQAAEFGTHMRGPAAYVPPRPGPGHAWEAGYRANGYWVPGRWNYNGGRERAPFARFEGERRGREFGRHFDRERGPERHRR